MDMATSQQKLKSLYIEQLKNLKDFEIDFDGNQLTAILGPNCSGKSTILHALACIYKPINNDSINYKFSQFFPPTNHTAWINSKFKIIHDYRIERDLFQDVEVKYTKQVDRWAPKYERRPERYVSFIGVKSSVPTIENEIQKSRIQFNTQPLNDLESIKTKEIVGFIFNRNYDTFNKHVTPKQKTYFGVSYGGIQYSSLSMGAGEQRAFYIIGEILKAPKNALILIDEIDLLMHKTALQKLLLKANDIAVEKNIQIVFTTHNHSILKFDFINYRHILQTPIKTVCFNDTKPDAIQRLTGEQQKPVEFFVEDNLSKSIIRKISADLGVVRYVSVTKFGAATNCFTAVAGALLKNLGNLGNMSFILDGDVYRSIEEKRYRIKKVLSGDDSRAEELRAIAETKIYQFNIPENIKPEKYYHSCLCKIDTSLLGAQSTEIVNAAKEIEVVDDSHKYLFDIIERLGYGEESGYDMIINVLSKTSEWPIIIQNIQDWLAVKKSEIIES